MTHLLELNGRQREAVLQKNGPILIIAGAGAGKTKTIAHRILHLIKEGINPKNILAITFTNKATKEMRERVEKIILADKTLMLPISHSFKPFISTFHSLGVYILKENGKLIGLTRNFSIMDRSDSSKLVKECLKNLDMDTKQFEPSKILNIISKEKGDLNTIENYSAGAEDGYTLKSVAAKVWPLYEQKLAQEKALDFDDLLLKTYNILKNHKDILEKYQNLWKYIHIDEYQDTNKVQYMTAKLLAEKNENICVVGDIDQSIYSWRGADIQNILSFEEDYPEAKIILLEQNYRSTQTILAVANEVIKNNKLRREKKLFTKNDIGEKVSFLKASNEMEEAGFIARKSQELVSKGVSPREIAVLYRANFQSRVLEEAFLTENIPYQVLGTKFFERKEVKDILAFLRASLNPESLSDLKRIINVPARGIGKVTILKIFEGLPALPARAGQAGGLNKLPDGIKEKVNGFFNLLAKIKNETEKLKPSEIIKYIIKESGLELKLQKGNDEDRERLENMRELATLAIKYDYLSKPEGIEKLLEESALATDQDSLDKNENAVKLMTVHVSKGLEFDYVFITGLEQDLFPHQRIGIEVKTPEETRLNESFGQVEEERRLFYVALTRARIKLFLTYAEIRTIYGSQQMNLPSIFLGEFDNKYLEEENFEYREKIVYLEW